MACNNSSSSASHTAPGTAPQATVAMLQISCPNGIDGRARRSSAKESISSSCTVAFTGSFSFTVGRCPTGTRVLPAISLVAIDRSEAWQAPADLCGVIEIPVLPGYWLLRILVTRGVRVGVRPARHSHPSPMSCRIDFGLRIDLRIDHIGEVIRVGNSGLIHVLSHADQPAAKIVETVIGSTSTDGVGRSPEIDRFRSERQTIEDMIPFDDLVWGQVLQLCFEIVSPLIGFAQVGSTSS